jgi:hypothetical protein
MGEAKRRGTLEERKSNPKGQYNPLEGYWTEERKQEVVERVKQDMNDFFTYLKTSFLGKSKPPKKKKIKRIKTGG